MMITDRTLLDVERWKYLRDKGWDRMTDTERKEWLGEIVPTPAASKGMYTHNDLNRVESAVSAIAARFPEVSRKAPNLTVKIDWAYTDTFHRDDMERYLNNIRVLRDSFTVFKDTPTVPSIDSRLDYKQANNIEKILEDVNTVITNLSSSWYYTGEILCGEV